MVFPEEVGPERAMRRGEDDVELVMIVVLG